MGRSLAPLKCCMARSFVFLTFVCHHFKFTINKEHSLHGLFNVDPCRGLRKRLRIGYVSRGLSGAMRVPVAVVDGRSKLHTDIFIGYPKAPIEKKTSAG